jgi:tRNA pseudouridine38-40 synthase
MVADVEVPAAAFKMPVSRLPLAVNAHLPHDIRVVSAQRVALDFHSRFQATGKQYRYFLWNHPVMNPLLRTQAWHVPVKLDVPAMRAAAHLLLGRHDFRSFATTHSYEIKDTIRILTRCDLRRKGPLLTFVIEGDGFLYKMCRGIVGTLAQLGRGKFTESDLKAMLAARDRRVAGMTAPAHGLVLWKVFYQPARKSLSRSAKSMSRRRLAP